MCQVSKTIDQCNYLSVPLSWFSQLALPLVFLFLALTAFDNVQAVQVTPFEPMHFIRHTGAPVDESAIFTVDNLNGSFNLTVNNGGLEDDTALGKYASSSTITLNGIVVVGTQDFNQNFTSLTVPVNLMSTNHLIVRLNGKPGGVITVSVRGEVNTPPVADAGSNQTIIEGDNVTLDGSTSSDLEGDTLTYQWSLTGRPSASQAVISNADSVIANFDADIEGSYVAELVVNDGTVDSAYSQILITVIPQNQPPVLSPIGSWTINIGSELTLDLTATDVDGDHLVFSAQPFPLPEGASLQGESGEFRFKPSADQSGTIELTFSVSDGVFTVTETILLTIPSIDATATTRFSGRLLDANDYAQGISTPIVGTTISFLGTAQAAQSDAQGYFFLESLPAGTQVLDINSSTAQSAPDGSGYAGFRENYTLIAHVENTNERLFFMPRLDAASLTVVNPDSITVVNNPALGVSITVPPYTAKNHDGSNFTGELSISLVPRDLAPATLPDFMDPGLLVTIQPVGITFSTPVPFTFPNIDNLEPGSELNIWSVDPEMGAFVIVGTAQVTADGHAIETISGGVRAADWHTFLPPSPTPIGNPGPPPSFGCGSGRCCGGGGGGLGGSGGAGSGGGSGPHMQSSTSTITTLTGCLNTGFSLPDTITLGQPRGLTFVYKSQRAHPIKTIPFDSTIPVRSAVPPIISYETFVGGIRMGSETFISTTGLSENEDETIRGVASFDASDLATGYYPYQIRLTNNFTQSRISANISNRIAVINEKSNPIGAGWGLAGLSRLHVNQDGRVLIYDGNGYHAAYDFSRLDLGQWKQEGSAGDGNWIVSDDGLSVLQTINGNPTFFVGPTDLIDTTITGRFRVETSADDDFIGFVFGYQKPLAIKADNTGDYDFLLFDWKQTDQSGAQEGFTLSKVTGGAVDLWRHSVSNNLDVLATNYASGTGWQDNTEYEFELTYTTDQIKVSINGETIFNISGSFTPGRFGFYNFSQSNVRYENFLSTLVFETPEGDYSTLVFNTDNTFTSKLNNGTQIHFDGEGLQTEVIDRNGNSTYYAYDAKQRLVSITGPTGQVTTLIYSGDYLYTVTDSAGRISYFDYGQDGNLIKITFPDATFKIFGYDDHHLMTSETDQRGFTAIREYDGAGRISGATRADGSIHTASHEQTFGLVNTDGGLGTTDTPAIFVRPEDAESSFTDGEGHEKRTKADIYGRLISSTDANGLTTLIDRDENGNALKITSPNGSVTNQLFDAQGNLLSKTQAFNNSTTHYTYDPVYNLRTSVSDALNHTIFTHRDSKGNISAIVNPLGHTTRLTYNNAGQVIQTTSANGLVTDTTYNTAGLPVSISETPPANGGVIRTTQISYDNAGLATGITTDPEGSTVSLSYDQLGRIESVTDALNQKIEYHYDAAGNRTRIDTKASNGTLISTVSQDFDVLNRLTAIKQPHLSGQDSVQQFLYDGADNLTDSINANGHGSHQVYDSGNRLIEHIDAQLGSATFSYNTNGQITRVVAPNGAVTDTQIDALDRISSETSTDRGTISYSYDLNNNLISMTDARGITTSYSYDELNRLTAIQYPESSENVTLIYDQCTYGIGQLCHITDTSGNTAFEYDAYGNITQITEIREGISYTRYYQYDGSHRLVRETLPSGRQINYSRDNLQRIHSISTDINSISQVISSNIEYNASNQVIQRNIGNGLIENRSYDLQNRLLQQTLNSLDQAGFSYDANSNVLTRHTTTDNHSYSYDLIDRLVQEINNGTQSDYQYDANANRTQETQNTQSIFYDYAPYSNQLETIATGTTSQPLLYDASGNLTQDVQGREYRYNNAGRLKDIIGSGQTQANYRYNANGQRTHKITGSQAIHYHYDLAGHLSSETLNDGTPVRDYLWHNNTLVAQIDYQSGTEVLSYLHADHLNTPRLATSSNQSVVWRWEGDAFGKAQPQSLGATINFRFPGQYFDQETGLHYNYFRYYDPSTGRYITSDPIGLDGGLNTYGYVGGNPLSYIDPLGLYQMCHRDLLLPIPFARHCYVKYGDGTTSSYDPSGVNPDPDQNQEGTMCTEPKEPENDDCIKKAMEKCQGSDYNFTAFNCCHCVEQAMKECRTSIHPNEWPNWPINPGPQSGEPGYSSFPVYNPTLGQ